MFSSENSGRSGSQNAGWPAWPGSPTQLSAVPARSAHASAPARALIGLSAPFFVHSAAWSAWSVDQPGGAQSCPLVASDALDGLSASGLLASSARYWVPTAPQSEVT